MMTFTFVDVIARYLLNAPLHGGTVITEILLVGVIFLGLPLATQRDEHIVIDLCDRWIPAALVPAQRRIVLFFCGAACAFLAWRLYLKARFVATTGETTAALGISAAAIIYPMSLLIAVTAIVFLTRGISRNITTQSGSS
jgi:TRAP-type C4-dicarboxylate transport system permease small subunit